MNEREAQALNAILSSKNYGELCPDTIKRVFEAKLPLYKSWKEAEKAARTQLHRITGAFMSAADLKQAERLAQEYAAGNEDALDEVLLLHSSTRERKEHWRMLYERTFAAMGNVPRKVLDLACGLNPIALGALGIASVQGYDIQGGAVRTINMWAEAAGWNVRAACADLLCNVAPEEADLALMMKLLPLLEQQKRGCARALMENCPAKALLVTFPTRTLSGRNVGMETQYARWMEENMPPSLEIQAQYTVGTELCYLLRRKG